VPPASSLLLLVAASVPLVLVPGPAVAFVLSTTLRSGRRAGLAGTLGVETGYLVHVLGAVVGVSAVVAASAAAFTAVKLAGALWLLWLALRAWRRRDDAVLGGLRASPPLPPGVAWRRGLLVGALNPKTAVFFLAFLPQFVAGAAPVPLQLLVLGLVFIAVALALDSCWVLAGAGLGRVLPRLRDRVLDRVLDRVSAVVYAALAVVTLTARRAAG
jgi:threonine/homoserine/homoserine lactone efflux protein